MSLHEPWAVCSATIYFMLTPLSSFDCLSSALTSTSGIYRSSFIYFGEGSSYSILSEGYSDYS